MSNNKSLCWLTISYRADCFNPELLKENWLMVLVKDVKADCLDHHNRYRDHCSGPGITQERDWAEL